MDGGQGREGPLTHLHPTQSFDKIELLECIRRLVEVDQDWVPGSVGTSLYVRPVLIGNEVGRLRGLRSHTWGAGCLPEGEGPGTQAWVREGAGGLDSWVPDAPFRPSQPSLGVGHPTRALLFVILSPVGAYFPGDALKPVSLLADPSFIRAWVGGVGDYKLGG